MTEQQGYEEYLSFGGTKTRLEWVAATKHWPYGIDSEGLITAVLAWWEEHQHDTDTVYDHEGYTEHYNRYNEPPEFVRIAQELKAN